MGCDDSEYEYEDPLSVSRCGDTRLVNGKWYGCDREDGHKGLHWARKLMVVATWPKKRVTHTKGKE